MALWPQNRGLHELKVHLAVWHGIRFLLLFFDSWRRFQANIWCAARSGWWF